MARSPRITRWKISVFMCISVSIYGYLWVENLNLMHTHLAAKRQKLNLRAINYATNITSNSLRKHNDDLGSDTSNTIVGKVYMRVYKEADQIKRTNTRSAYQTENISVNYTYNTKQTSFTNIDKTKDINFNNIDKTEGITLIETSETGNINLNNTNNTINIGLWNDTQTEDIKLDNAYKSRVIELDNKYKFKNFGLCGNNERDDTNLTNDLLEGVERWHTKRSLHKKEEIRQVMFAKVHKAASSTVQNVLLRFAISRKLNVMLKKYHTSLQEHKSRVNNEGMLSPRLSGQLFDILCCHIVWNKEYLEKFFPPGTPHVAIIREPMSQAVSALRYYGKTMEWLDKYMKKGLQKYDDDPINGYINHPEEFSGFNHSQGFLNNRQSFDLGFDEETLDISKRNRTKIVEFVRRVDKEFDLVMIAEYFDESMVLLRRLLNWSMRDILYIKINAFGYHPSSNWNKKPLLNEKISQKFCRWACVDYTLYDYFLAKFRMIFDREPRIDEEVTEYKKILGKVLAFCKDVHVGQEATILPENLIIQPGNFTDGFRIPKSECLTFKMHEPRTVATAYHLQVKRFEKMMRRLQNISLSHHVTIH